MFHVVSPYFTFYFLLNISSAPSVCFVLRWGDGATVICLVLAIPIASFSFSFYVHYPDIIRLLLFYVHCPECHLGISFVAHTLKTCPRYRGVEGKKQKNHQKNTQLHKKNKIYFSVSLLAWYLCLKNMCKMTLHAIFACIFAKIIVILQQIFSQWQIELGFF